MVQCKITVLKRMLNPELADEYSDIQVPPCDVFSEGQVFTVNPFRKPKDFCAWAWDDIYKTILTLSRGGNFSEGTFKGWMKSDKTMIACCSDGIRPVVFKVERMEDERE